MTDDPCSSNSANSCTGRDDRCGGLREEGAASRAGSASTSACRPAPPPPAAPPPPPPPPAPPPPPPPPPPPAPAAAAVPAPAALSEEEVFARKSVEQINAEHPLDDVYFDLDKSDVRTDGRASLQKD